MFISIQRETPASLAWLISAPTRNVSRRLFICEQSPKFYLSPTKLQLSLVCISVRVFKNVFWSATRVTATHTHTMLSDCSHKQPLCSLKCHLNVNLMPLCFWFYRLVKFNILHAKTKVVKEKKLHSQWSFYLSSFLGRLLHLHCNHSVPTQRELPLPGVSQPGLQQKSGGPTERHVPLREVRQRVPQLQVPPHSFGKRRVARFPSASLLIF